MQKVFVIILRNVNLLISFCVYRTRRTFNFSLLEVTSERGKQNLKIVTIFIVMKMKMMHTVPRAVAVLVIVFVSSALQFVDASVRSERRLRYANHYYVRNSMTTTYNYFQIIISIDSLLN